MNFDHSSLNELLGMEHTREIPFICINNPFVYVEKDKMRLFKGGQSWTAPELKNLLGKFESSAEALDKFFNVLKEFEIINTKAF